MVKNIMGYLYYLIIWSFMFKVLWDLKWNVFKIEYERIFVIDNLNLKKVKYYFCDVILRVYRKRWKVYDYIFCKVW